MRHKGFTLVELLVANGMPSVSRT
ncbi:prepilin-type N-terminal cleavage/methylation domain-containing protein [Candidatus Uhrbacteria bacterium]|nr:prepilin-type N-terminal cleavage/methylation domain-containing protein [Candidatus Uhrbacteria bacterium]